MNSGTQVSLNTDLRTLFYPKTIAVIGVNKNRVGGIKFVFANQEFVTQGGGQVYPINPKYEELYGFRVYPSLFHPEVPDIDLAYISVQADAVPELIRECGKKRVKFVVIFTSGFGESGNMELQTQLENAIKDVKPYTRIIGPNCLGINNPYSKIHYYPGMPSAPGNISYVSMSGGNTGRLASWQVSQGLGFHNIVSIGNSIDLTPADFIFHFLKDEKTKTIALYLESISDGRRFIEAVRKTTLTKPIILLKGGQSEAGIRAVHSHTGGLAGSSDIWQAISKQYGIIYTDHFELFQDAVTTFSIDYHLPKNENVCVLVAGGGISVEIADSCIKYGLQIPSLSQETQQSLANVFPSINTNFHNPVDLGEYGYVPEFFAQALEIVAKDPHIETVLFVREAERFKLFQETLSRADMEEKTVESISNVLKKVQKPMICSTSPNVQNERAYGARFQFKINMLKRNLPVIDYIPNACKIIKQMVCYYRYLQKMERISKKKIES